MRCHLTVRFSIILSLSVLPAASCDAPPALLDLPASVTVREGRSASFVLDAELDVEASEPLTIVRDGDTVTITAPLGASDGSLTVNEADTIDVTVTPLAFERSEWLDDGPKAREHGAMFVSADGATIYMMQGGGYPNFPSQEVIDDAWQLDVASGTWSPWETSGDVPPAAGSRRAAQAPSGDIGFLFGGYDGDFVGNDELYRVDLATGVFTRIASQNAGPPPRALHAFAFDADGNRVIVYGGFYFDAGGAQDILADTWIGLLDDESDTVAWLEVSGGPPARYGMFFGFDELSSSFVVWSGAGFPSRADRINAHQDTWVLDLETSAWRELGTLEGAPAGRRNGCGVVDGVTRGLYVFGGTSDGATSEPGMFALDLERERWIAIAGRDGEPPVRSSSFGAPLPGGGIVCGMGNDDATYRDVFMLR